MQIVEQTKHRSGWRVYRTLAALGVPRSVYYAWKGRDSLEDQTAKPCRVYEVLPEERGAVLSKIHAPAVVGEIAFLDGGARTLDVVAATAGEG